jgi:hypothetical protein
MRCQILQTVTSMIYDARSFYFDLTAELRRLRSPRYPQREWHRALERADNADLARAAMARNASEDADYFDHQHSYEMLEEDRDPDPRFLGQAYTAHRAKLARAARAEVISS